MNKKIYLLIILLFICSFVYAGNLESGSLVKSLVAYWDLSQESLQSAMVFADKTPNGNIGTSVNAPSFTTDRHGNINQAMSFVSANHDYILLTGFISSSTSHSFVFWIKWISGDCYIVDIQTDRTIVAYYQNETRGYDGSWKTFGSAPSANVWHHLVCVMDGSTSKMRMYLDGNQYGNELAYVPRTLGGVISLGCRYQLLTQFLNGAIDDFRIYDRVLTTGEIQKLYEEQ